MASIFGIRPLILKSAGLLGEVTVTFADSALTTLVNAHPSLVPKLPSLTSGLNVLIDWLPLRTVVHQFGLPDYPFMLEINVLPSQSERIFELPNGLQVRMSAPKGGVVEFEYNPKPRVTHPNREDREYYFSITFPKDISVAVYNSDGNVMSRFLPDMQVEQIYVKDGSLKIHGCYKGVWKRMPQSHKLPPLSQHEVFALIFSLICFIPTMGPISAHRTNCF